MGKRTTPPRSFNTIRQSQCEQRAKRKQTARGVLLAIFITAVLLVVALAVLLICSIADSVSHANPNDNNGNSRDIIYEQYTKTKSGIAHGELILINKDHKYTFPATANSELVNMGEAKKRLEDSDIYAFSKSGNYLLNKTAVDAFHAMMIQYDAWSEGEGDIIVTTAYRTYDEQEGLNNRNPSSSEPGHSDHHSGYCIAIKAVSESHWIYDNAHKFGFVVRYPDDKAEITGVEDYRECLRYVGIPHATYMKENNLCLEEYVALLESTYKLDGKHLSVTGADGNSYEIYYVPLSGDEITTVDVPRNFAYTLSGDNNNGFIVAVNLNAPIE